MLKVVVCGGGPTGVELAAELADFAHNDVARRYGTDISERIQIILVEAMPRILAPFDEKLANVAKEHLVSKGVDVRTGTAVTYVESNDVTLAPSCPRNATKEQREAAAAAAKTEGKCDYSVVILSSSTETHHILFMAQSQRNWRISLGSRYRSSSTSQKACQFPRPD